MIYIIAIVVILAFFFLLKGHGNNTATRVVRGKSNQNLQKLIGTNEYLVPLVTDSREQSFLNAISIYKITDNNENSFLQLDVIAEFNPPLVLEGENIYFVFSRYIMSEDLVDTYAQPVHIYWMDKSGTVVFEKEVAQDLNRCEKLQPIVQLTFQRAWDVIVRCGDKWKTILTNAGNIKSIQNLIPDKEELKKIIDEGPLGSK